VAQRTVVIELGVSEILKGQMAHPLDRVVDRHSTRTHLLQQNAQLVLIHLC
jgi:hypothetical protein